MVPGTGKKGLTGTGRKKKGGEVQGSRGGRVVNAGDESTKNCCEMRKDLRGIRSAQDSSSKAIVFHRGSRRTKKRDISHDRVLGGGWREKRASTAVDAWRHDPNGEGDPRHKDRRKNQEQKRSTERSYRRRIRKGGKLTQKKPLFRTGIANSQEGGKGKRDRSCQKEDTVPD